MTGYGSFFQGSGWGGQGGLPRGRGRGRSSRMQRPQRGIGMEGMFPGAGGFGGGEPQAPVDSYQSMMGKPFQPTKSFEPPMMYSGNESAPGATDMMIPPGRGGGIGGGLSGGQMIGMAQPRQSRGRSPGYGRSPSPYGQSRFAPGGQFGDFDMSSMFRGIGDPYGGSEYSYGRETDHQFPWETTGGGGGGGEETTPPVDNGTWQQQNGGPDGGQFGGGDRNEVGSFGGWAGNMRDMVSDLWSGNYGGDAAYGGGNQSPPGSQEAAQAQAEATQGPDFQANGGVPRRHFEGGGGADTAGIGDMRGQGRDQAADPSWDAVMRDGRALIDMVTGVSPAMAALGIGGMGLEQQGPPDLSGDPGGPQVADAGGMGPEMGANMNARGGVIRRNMGGIGYAVGGEGDGRSDEIPALLSNGEHVIPADAVSAFGRGSTDAGHKALNDLILKTRMKYRKSLGKLPPPKG